MSLFANDFHFLAPQRALQNVREDGDVRFWGYFFNADIPGLPAELGCKCLLDLSYDEHHSVRARGSQLSMAPSSHIYKY
jgi:hypothetical protein